MTCFEHINPEEDILTMSEAGIIEAANAYDANVCGPRIKKFTGIDLFLEGLTLVPQCLFFGNFDYSPTCEKILTVYRALNPQGAEVYAPYWAEIIHA